MRFGYELIMSLDIGYTGFIEVFVAFFIAFLLDKILPRVDSSKTPTVWLLVEAAMFIGGLLIILHYVAGLVRRIPFPLLGMFGYTKRISEWYSLSLMTVFVLIYWDTIQTKLQILRKRQYLTTIQKDKSAPDHIANF